jgi:hypothetical protein
VDNRELGVTFANVVFDTPNQYSLATAVDGKQARSIPISAPKLGYRLRCSLLFNDDCAAADRSTNQQSESWEPTLDIRGWLLVSLEELPLALLSTTSRLVDGTKDVR